MVQILNSTQIYSLKLSLPFAVETLEGSLAKAQALDLRSQACSLVHICFSSSISILVWIRHTAFKDVYKLVLDNM